MLKRAVIFGCARCSVDCHKARFEAFAARSRNIGSINRQRGYFVDLAGRGLADASADLQSARHLLSRALLLRTVVMADIVFTAVGIDNISNDRADSRRALSRRLDHAGLRSRQLPSTFRTHPVGCTLARYFH